jgi:DNA-binding transcriptional MerR regulator
MIQVFGIKDLERVTGVPRTTIHYYLRQGLLPRPQKTAASRSLYTEDHVKILKEIAELKKAGRSIAQIEAELQHRVERANEANVDLVTQERERIHNRILALAIQEFAVKGYARTHVTALMRRLGITATVFYSHFPSKHALLAECVTVLLKWSLYHADETAAHVEDPAERFLREVFSHSRVFELGATGSAVLCVEAAADGAELRTSIEQSLEATVARIAGQFPTSSSPGTGSGRAVSDTLMALGLVGAYERTALCAPAHPHHSREEVLRAHLWLFLAVQAALSGEVDIDSRLARYDRLITELGATMPPLPPELET